MIDGFGRNIDYIRISVTDRCNLRCKYCMPPQGVELLRHDELLTLEEIARLVKIMAKMGIKKVRITGGEPLVRRNLEKLIADIHDIPEIDEIAITTNGTLLKGRIKDLKEKGINAINISLDTLDRCTFENITGYDLIDNVTDVIDEVLANDIKCKLNCVPCVELNGDGLEKMALIASKRPVDVRFIELMPIGCGKNFTGIPSNEILDRLEKAYGKASIAYDDNDTKGPAQYFIFEGFKGRIGFISPISHRFCSECNRIRLTADGGLKLCLHYNQGIDLKKLLRQNDSDEMIEKAIEQALKTKPMRHEFDNQRQKNENFEDKKMVQIGG
jgi:cyclic pyranopterin phosphate synthase